MAMGTDMFGRTVLTASAFFAVHPVSGLRVSNWYGRYKLSNEGNYLQLVASRLPGLVAGLLLELRTSERAEAHLDAERLLAAASVLVEGVSIDGVSDMRQRAKERRDLLGVALTAIVGFCSAVRRTRVLSSAATRSLTGDGWVT